MKLLILGASGGCGQWAARLARERGHRVTALVRPETIYAPPDGIEVIRGQVLQQEDMERALSGQDAVLSCIGIRRVMPQNPWSIMLSPSNLTSHIARIIVDAMKKQEVRRIVAISAAGVADSRDALHPVVRFMIDRGNVGVAYRDLAFMEAVFAQSGIDWLAVRPVTLAKGGPTGRAGHVGYYGITSKITRGDVAAFMLDAVEQAQPFSNHTVMIGSKQER